MTIRKLSLASITGAGKSNNFWDATTIVATRKGYLFSSNTSGFADQKINTISYLTDTTVQGGIVITGNQQGAGLNNGIVRGYQTSGNPRATTGYSMSYVTGAFTTKTGFLATAVSNTSPVTNNGVAGYIAGGLTPSITNIIQKVPYATETGSTISATLASNLYAGSGCSPGVTVGYFPAGDTNSGNFTNRIDKISFAADTRTTLSATLSVSLYARTGSNNGTTAGYVVGGGNGGSNVIDKIVFSTETSSALSAVSRLSVRSQQSAADKGNALYITGGYDGTAAGGCTQVSKLSFTTETRTDLGSGANVQENTDGFTQTALSGSAY